MIIKKLSSNLISSLTRAFSSWPKSVTLFERYFQEQENDERNVWVALKDNKAVGYVTLKWHSAYKPFQKKNIPEINDLNVLPRYRNQGIGSLLLDAAEAAASQKINLVGLGVGLYADYGPATRLYIRRGYVPDSKGITYNNEYVAPCTKVIVDDKLIVWLVKNVSDNQT